VPPAALPGAPGADIRSLSFASSIFDRRQRLFEPRAQMCVLARYLQGFAQMLNVLVAVETGTVGGDLEEDAARGAEIDRQEIVAVDHRRGPVPGMGKRLAHDELVLRALDGEGDVMDGARALAGGRQT